MIFKDIDLFDISNQATINIIENNIYLDLSNVKANGHRLNIDNRLVECVRLSTDTITSLNEWMEIINKLEISFDNIEWIEISSKNFILDKSNRIEINLNEKYKIKFIKLNINNKYENFIDKIKIEILNRKFPGLMVAARSDGFGARFMPILNAMYLSSKLGYKFGIVWAKTNYDQTSLKKLDNNELAGLYQGDEEFIFDKEFLNSYSYLGKISAANIPAEKHDINDYLKIPHSENFGYYVSYDITGLQGLDKDYLKEYPKLWKQIKFTKPVNDIIDDIDIKNAKYFPNKFIAIHIRAGDGVYDYIRSGLDAFWRKMMPNEIAMALIDENLKINNDIVLFGDDFTQLRELKNFYNNKIYLIEDFIDDTIVGIKRVIFDIVFLSKAKEIYSGGSSFAKTASYIGLGKRPTYYFEYFTEDKMIDIIKNYFNKDLNLHQYQKSYSLLFLHNLCLRKNISKDELITILNEGRSYDKDNCAFIIHIFNHYIYLKEYDKANNILSILFDMPDFDWMYKYIIRYKDSIYKVFVTNILKHSEVKYSNISYVAAKISIDTKLTRSRVLKYIQNYLLGLEINDGSKYLLNYYINIAEKLNISINQINSQIEATTKNDSYLKSELENKKIALKKQIDINRSNEILLQNIKSENQKLQKLNADLSLAYNAAKSNAKNYLSYKLGQALIKASKNWYKGGYIKFIFEAIKITKEHKKRCK
ncbi:hypothetical protein [Campylobacter hyointestinalis]|uniref:hypothetical protein n=1 Tax=Campylobacter hyointestinalis TaxID=198 RepID=UPI000DCF0EEC|nr:hypothetical protein [Campylobacter hyointestinalis]RAZ37264.1 hypothetical protein CHL9426_09185 [Campylobacter hyointestinalis subsp. lawsonii]RAZ51007.1 hypothetical protein CHL10075_09000 [Campylobacter hyointestinalis subsp. lawsonii]